MQEAFDLERVEFSVADFRLGGKRILLEIHSRETTTYITMAIHLGKWW